MPHAEMPYEDVDVVYASIDDALSEARQRGYRTAIAGDFDAVVGSSTDDDDPSIIGSSPMRKRSSRCDFLLKWCTFTSFVITNKFDGYDFTKAWTFKDGEQLKLDYILAGKTLTKCILSSYVVESFDIGSDHQAVVLTFRYGHEGGRRRRGASGKW